MKELIRVVLIEDDPDDFALVRKELGPRGDNPFQFELEGARTLKAGLELLAAKQAHVVLLDLFLPDCRGLDTYLAIQKRHPNLPVVVLTGLSDEAMALSAIRAGAQDYLVKGTLTATLLQRALRYAVERSRWSAGFENAIQTAPDAVVLVGADGLVQYANPAGAALFGRGLVIGSPFPFPEALEFAAEMKVRIGGEERIVEFRPGEAVWKSGPARLIWARDLTELKKAALAQAEVRERRRLDQMKDELMNAVSHELRSPLSIISAAVENLTAGLAGALPQAAVELVEMAHRQCERLTRVVENLLELARLESGKPLLRRGRVTLLDVARPAFGGYRLVADKRSIKIIDSLPDGLPDLNVDPELLHRVIGNLLDNGIRFARSRVEIRAQALAAATAGGSRNGGEPRFVQITVEDDGPGLSAEEISTLFDRFVQVRRVARSGYRGTGLGLTICKEICERHGGKIWAESEPGRGTRFHFILPAL
jgi:signal transduction histidine kinase